MGETLDKKLVAEKIRTFLENRVTPLLGCESADLPHMKIGSMVHLILTLIGDGETTGGFNTTMSVLNTLIGFELLWDIEPKTEEVEAEQSKAVIN